MPSLTFPVAFGGFAITAIAHAALSLFRNTQLSPANHWSCDFMTSYPMEGQSGVIPLKPGNTFHIFFSYQGAFAPRATQFPRTTPNRPHLSRDNTYPNARSAEHSK